jgi:hypothetical protein
MGHMTKYLVELSNKRDLKNVAQQPDVILQVNIESFCSLFFFFLLEG